MGRGTGNAVYATWRGWIDMLVDRRVVFRRHRILSLATFLSYYRQLSHNSATEKPVRLLLQQATGVLWVRSPAQEQPLITS